MRKCQHATDESISDIYPDLELYLEEDINIESELDKLVSNYLNFVELPQSEQINLENLKNE